MHHEHPELIKDQYWDEVFPSQLPYTVASVQNKESEPQPSTANIEVNKRAAEVIPVVPSSNKIEEMVGKTSSTAYLYRFPERGDAEGGDDTNDDDEKDPNDEVRPPIPRVPLVVVGKVHKNWFWCLRMPSSLSVSLWFFTLTM